MVGALGYWQKILSWSRAKTPSQTSNKQTSKLGRRLQHTKFTGGPVPAAHVKPRSKPTEYIREALGHRIPGSNCMFGNLWGIFGESLQRPAAGRVRVSDSRGHGD